jgi:hypothetical protein
VAAVPEAPELEDIGAGTVPSAARGDSGCSLATGTRRSPLSAGESVLGLGVLGLVLARSRRKLPSDPAPRGHR